MARRRRTVFTMWEGELIPPAPGAEDRGTVRVETLFAEVRGRALHLVPRWDLTIPPEPGMDDPTEISAELPGILNLENGAMILNAIPPEPGVPPQPGRFRGEAEFHGDGTLSLVGEVVFHSDS